MLRMQGLSSRAHAFSVEALVGKPCKKMKVSGGHESSLDTGSNTSVFTGETEGSLHFWEHHVALMCRTAGLQYLKSLDYMVQTNF